MPVLFWLLPFMAFGLVCLLTIYLNHRGGI